MPKIDVVRAMLAVQVICVLLFLCKATDVFDVAFWIALSIQMHGISPIIQFGLKIVMYF